MPDPSVPDDAPDADPDRLGARLAERVAGDTIALTQEAGAQALRWFRPGERTAARIWAKAGGSPVTEADIAVDTFLKIRLSQLLPEAAWLSEETADDPARLTRRAVWVVDPIDGTRAFLDGHAEWAVSVALLVDNRPVLGVLCAPAHAAVYAARRGVGATRNDTRLSVSAPDGWEGARVAGPRGALEALARTAPGITLMPKMPSLALRLAHVASGTLDAGLVSTDARDWDIAAADLILTEAGGRLTTLPGAAPAYNQRVPRHGAMVASGAGLHAALLEQARRLAADGRLDRLPSRPGPAQGS